jgi:hypothetical protein
MSLRLAFLVAVATLINVRFAHAEGPTATPAPWPVVPPERFAYDPRLPGPSGYHVESSANGALVTSGAVIFGVSYGLAVIAAASSRSGERFEALVPIAGPFIVAAGYHNSDDPGNAIAYYIALDGVLQAAGATLFVMGELMRDEALVRDDARPSATPSGSHRTQWQLLPTSFGHSGAGVGLVGAF